MKVASLADAPGSASARYRIEQYAPYLAGSGIEVDSFTIAASLTGRIALFRRLRAFDAIVLQRRLLGAAGFLLLRRNARKLIYDFDDALFRKDSFQGAGFSLTRTTRFRRTVRSADVVVTGNRYLAEEARKYNQRCLVIPTVVDLNRYPDIYNHRGGDGPFRAVWIGSAATLPYLEAILPALAPAARAIPGFSLIVMSDRFPRQTPLQIERVSWTAAGEATVLAQADVGLMPLSDDAWTRGKCGLKLIQYGAAGLPSVCSPVGVNSSIVVEGVTGLFARSEGDWTRALEQLASSADLRRRMGRAARRRIEKRYSVVSQLPRWVEILRG